MTAQPAIASPEGADGGPPAARTPRWPLAVIAAGMVTLFLLQAPGRLVADTKMNVPLDPLRFMEWATHLWNSSADFGFLPNQYIGYLFPMGPFFLLGKVMGVPAWITQRLWMALILTVAAWGLVRLADALRIGRPWTRVVAGVGYGLSPMFIGKIGASSVALTGAAMLPWITLPLVLALRPDGAGGIDTGTAAGTGPDASAAAARRLSPRRAAALSGLAIVCTGGVNASVTLCVLVCPAVLLVFAGGSRRAWALRAWWVLAVFLATAWWLLALMTQSRYGLNFLPFTETAATTTSPTSVAEALRGTTDWLAYLRVPAPWLPAASVDVTNPVAVVGSAVATAIGLWGLARRDLPARRFLIVSLAAGIVAVSAAYPGQPGSPLADGVRHLLSGQLGFLRNVYKFESVAHVPLALGIAHALHVVSGTHGQARSADAAGEVPAWRRRLAAALGRLRRPARLEHSLPRLRPRSAIAGVLVLAAVGTGVMPAFEGQMFQAGTFKEVPGYWHQAADWLASNPAGGTTLVLPAKPFAEYDWGRPLDEPMAFLASTPWAARSLIPLGNAGMTRWMDGIEQELALGSASGLADALARAGVGQVLIRNDISDEDWDNPPSTSEIYRALANSGLRRAATFGPMKTARPSARDRLIAGKAKPTQKVPALDVWVVPNGATQVTAYPADTTMVVSGGSEATVQMAAHGVLGTDRAVVLANDLSGLPGAPDDATTPSGGLVPPVPASDIIGPTTAMVTTDTLTRRETDFGVIHNATSYLLGPDENAAGETGPPHQWLDEPADGHQTVAAYENGVQVRASSYGSKLVARPDVSPAAAVDGLPFTSWSVVADPSKGSVGGWIEVDVPKATSVPYIDVQLLEEGSWRPAVQALRVTTSTGSVVTTVRSDETTQRLAVPAGASTSFRVTFEKVTQKSGSTYGAGIRELKLPGVAIQRYVQTPSDTAGLFTAGVGQVAYTFDREAVDVTEPFGGSEELSLHRRFDVPRPMTFAVLGTTTGVPSLTVGSAVPAPAFELPCGKGPAVIVDGTRYELRVEGQQSDIAAAKPLGIGVCTPDGTIPLSAGQHDLQIDEAGTGLLMSSLTLVGAGGQISTDKARSTTVTSWGSERRTVQIGSGTRALLAVHENANASWTATLGGQRLTPLRLDGWQQGWIVPAGSGGTIVIENLPGYSYRTRLFVGGLLALLLIALALLPGRWRLRRSVEPDDYPRFLNPWTMPVVGRLARVPGWLAGGLLGTIAVFLVAGPVALAVPVLVLVGRRYPPALGWTTLLFMIASGVGVAVRPDAVPTSHAGAFGPFVQTCGAIALAAVVAALALRGSAPQAELAEPAPPGEPADPSPPTAAPPPVVAPAVGNPAETTDTHWIRRRT
ncbi:alpha-(1-_3)-arabinofuranosyltransferase family protein [Pseudofrankia sp. DC12]|uniref:alpha-(1->3)-arabinofuranosyltransferase domain-containing protein n=1 Tax=Pseudofrankia sp. DC12 TaxID=683315 RepID=UPI0005F88430|nr:alpha-(1->3)-arabinofuranosyltransferase family protein [Pseudofrankia sp. DC12]